MTRLLESSGQSSYGLTFSGLPSVPELTAASAEAGHGLEVRVACTPQVGPRPRGATATAEVRRLADGRTLALRRSPAGATFFGPPIDPSLLAHPYLAPVASTFNRWLGREAFHAGAFVLGGRAWVLLGPRTAGKSSLLAALADHGLEVLSDDLVITDGSVVFWGPRCIDLRESLPGATLALQPARMGTRWRLRLTPAGPPVPLGGWLFLRWGPQLGMELVPPTKLIGRLVQRRCGPDLATDPMTLLSLAGRPGWDLTRARGWDLLEDTEGLLNEQLPGPGRQVADAAQSETQGATGALSWA